MGRRGKPARGFGIPRFAAFSRRRVSPVNRGRVICPLRASARNARNIGLPNKSAFPLTLPPPHLRPVPFLSYSLALPSIQFRV